jgi:DNA-binding transcriptional regulator YdaS (Cro superfamily)
MEVVITQLGGTAAAVADKLAISPRTVEAWRSGKAPLPIKAAYSIAEALAVAE